MSLRSSGLRIRFSNSNTHSFAISPLDPREFCSEFPALFDQRAQGMPGARCARSRAWCVVNTRVSHHGHTGNTRHSLRNGFNGLFRALPGDRALLPPSSADVAANLTPASGRQDHTTSPYALAPFVIGASASTASRPASVTIANRPSVGRDDGDIG